MDVVSTMNKVNKFGRIFVILVMLLSFANVMFAGDNIYNALKELCTQAQALLGVTAVVLAVVAAIVYAAGQIMGAETRARASVWATSMIIGAIIGLVIYLILPVVIGKLVPVPAGVIADNPCLSTAGARP